MRDQLPKTKIGAVTTKFDVNASRDSAFTFTKHKLSRYEKVVDALQTDTIRLNEELFGRSKGAVD
jgi:hypothetical protein